MEVVEWRLYVTETNWPLVARPDNFKRKFGQSLVFYDMKNSSEMPIEFLTMNK